MRIFVASTGFPVLLSLECTAHLLRSPLSVIFSFQTHLPLSVRDLFVAELQYLLLDLTLPAIGKGLAALLGAVLLSWTASSSQSDSSCYPSTIWPVDTSKPSTPPVDVKAWSEERCQSVESHRAPRVECAHRGATHAACAAIPQWRRRFQHPAACRPCERRRL